jgi:nucleotide-binding universal stress UspA family protein
MFRNILVSVDGSTDADQALTEAIDLAKVGRGLLTIITAVHPLSALAFAGMAWAAADGNLPESLERESQEILRTAERRVPKDVSVTTILTHEPIRKALLEAIIGAEYDLVAMGSRGRGAVGSAVLGSVSHYVLNHSPIPVLIIPGDRHSTQIGRKDAPDVLTST